jgi:hypothetical protein
LQLGDGAPDARPDQQPWPVAISKHQIGVPCSLQLGMFAECMHHRVRSLSDIEFGQDGTSRFCWIGSQSQRYTLPVTDSIRGDIAIHIVISNYRADNCQGATTLIEKVENPSNVDG